MDTTRQTGKNNLRGAAKPRPPETLPPNIFLAKSEAEILREYIVKSLNTGRAVLLPDDLETGKAYREAQRYGARVRIRRLTIDGVKARYLYAWREGQ